MDFSKDKLHADLFPIPFAIKAASLLLTKKFGFKLMDFFGKVSEGSDTKGLHNQQVYIKSRSGNHKIRVRIYRPENNTEKLPVMLYNHGGGYAMGSPEQNGEIFKSFIEKRPCVIVSAGYRRSIAHPYPAAFNDCYDTLLWIRDNAATINVNADKLMVAGHSAGGGLTAAVTLKARDTKDVNIAFQMPIYPMLDDRQNSESSQFDSPAWGKKSNAIGWDFYLKNIRNQNKETPKYAAPGRNTDYSDFPPTLTFVGGFEPFRDETIQYVKGLEGYGIPVKFKLFEGCYHGFEIVAPKKQISIDAMNFLYEGYAAYYDKYL